MNAQRSIQNRRHVAQRSIARARGTTVVHRVQAYPKISNREIRERFADVAANYSRGELAKAAGATKEAAKLWHRASRTPNAESLINMARGIPEVRYWLLSEIAHGDETFEFDTPKKIDAIYKMMLSKGANRNG